MGIDTAFVRSQGACMNMKSFNNSNSIGAVIFIQMLLRRAGVEPNPGPNELNVRCWVLIEQGGTQVLKDVFDDIVGTDIMKYLNADPKRMNTLKRVLDKDQALKFPPHGQNPKSSTFDISLLVRLLKNVCDKSKWNVSLETYIVKLLKCRNIVFHGKMYSSNVNDLWVEIEGILHDLNNAARKPIPNLQQKIDDIAVMDIDEKRKKQYNEALSQWKDMNISLKCVTDRVCKDFQEIEELFEDSVTGQCEQSQKMTTGCDGSSENPEKILWQYMCVLFDVGKEMLRTLFEELTKDKTDKISDTQKFYLPLESTDTALENLNIVTLHCLLRNVCGLPKPYDWVWIAPLESNCSVAANITRLRDCSYKVFRHNKKTWTQQDLNELIVILDSQWRW